jgi:hypothetical protein
MTAGEDREIWFPEPARADDTAANRGEPTTDWLGRSTHPRAMAARRFLNENLRALPQEHRADLYRALHDRWGSAFFELIVGRTLQVLGAAVKVEPGGASDVRVDFAARFPDGAVAVEAVSPVFGADVGETARRRNPLLDIVESESPPDVWVMVSSLPDIGPQDSRKPFRATVRGLLDGAWDVGYDMVEVSEELLEGTLRLKLVKKGPGVPPGRSVGIEPALTTWDDTERRIRRAVSRKRRQGRQTDVLALVAVHATGIASSYEEVDTALFGREVATVDATGRLLGTRFEADGAFAGGSGEPTWAGALVFLNVGFTGGPDPVLYLHPRFGGRLPEALVALERRSYDARAGAIVIKEPSATGVLGALKFVSRDI